MNQQIHWTPFNDDAIQKISEINLYPPRNAPASEVLAEAGALTFLFCCFFLFYSKLLQFLCSLLQIMEFNGMNTKLLCTSQFSGRSSRKRSPPVLNRIWKEVSHKYQPPVWSAEPHRRKSHHPYFQKRHFTWSCLIQHELAVVWQNVQMIALAFQIAGPGFGVILNSNCFSWFFDHTLYIRFVLGRKFCDNCFRYSSSGNRPRSRSFQICS